MPGGAMGDGSNAGGGAQGVQGARGAIRVFRSAALATGAAGVLEQVPWDKTSPEVTAVGMALAGGRVLVAAAGIACVDVKLQASGVALLSGFRIRISRSPNTPREFIADDSTYRQVATVGPFSIQSCARFEVGHGDTIRVDAASVGVGGVDCVVGDSSTWCSVTLM